MSLGFLASGASHHPEEELPQSGDVTPAVRWALGALRVRVQKEKALPTNHHLSAASSYLLTILGVVQRTSCLSVGQRMRAEAGIQLGVVKMLELG